MQGANFLWDIGCPLPLCTACDAPCCGICLAPSAPSRILLPRDGCYLVSFAVNLVALPNSFSGASIALQAVCGTREQTQFVYTMPFSLPSNAQFTASAGGISISTCGMGGDCALQLVLTAPRCVIATNATISVLAI